MTIHTLIIRGERYLTLAGVAEAYSLELTWIREVYDYRLLGEGEHVPGGATGGHAAAGDDIAIAEVLLDRVATIERLHRAHGVNLPGIALILELLEEQSP